MNQRKEAEQVLAATRQMMEKYPNHYSLQVAYDSIQRHIRENGMKQHQYGDISFHLVQEGGLYRWIIVADGAAIGEGSTRFVDDSGIAKQIEQMVKAIQSPFAENLDAETFLHQQTRRVADSAIQDADRLAELLTEAVPYIDYAVEAEGPAEGHLCGPDSNCDSICQNHANGCSFLQKVKDAVKQHGEEWGKDAKKRLEEAFRLEVSEGKQENL